MGQDSGEVTGGGLAPFSVATHRRDVVSRHVEDVQMWRDDGGWREGRAIVVAFVAATLDRKDL